MKTPQAEGEAQGSNVGPDAAPDAVDGLSSDIMPRSAAMARMSSASSGFLSKEGRLPFIPGTK
eukprot:scaffold664118_cov52-Prasinocladus_malaysianus.AAC.1